MIRTLMHNIYGYISFNIYVYVQFNCAISFVYYSSRCVGWSSVYVLDISAFVFEKYIFLGIHIQFLQIDEKLSVCVCVCVWTYAL